MSCIHPQLYPKKQHSKNATAVPPIDWLWLGSRAVTDSVEVGVKVSFIIELKGHEHVLK